MPEHFLLTSSFESIEKRQRFDPRAEPAQDLPLHLTIQQYFTLGHVPAFLNALQNYATRQTPFEVVGGSFAMFGERLDTPVTQVTERMGRLGIFHDQTLALIEKFEGEVLHPGWHGAGYHPHITHTRTRKVRQGDMFEVRSLELIRGASGEVKTVEAVIPLSQERRS